MVLGNGEDSVPYQRIRLPDFYSGGVVTTDSVTVEMISRVRRTYPNLEPGDVFDILVNNGYQPAPDVEFSEWVVAVIMETLRRASL